MNKQRGTLCALRTNGISIVWTVPPFSGPPIPYTPEMFPDELGLRLNIRILCETILNPKLCNRRVADKFTDGALPRSSVVGSKVREAHKRENNTKNKLEL